MTTNIGNAEKPLKHHAESLSFDPLTADPSSTEKGEMWLRTDLDGEVADQLATLRFNDGSTVRDIPVLDLYGDHNYHGVLGVDINGQRGIIPVDDPEEVTLPELAVQLGNSRLGFDSLQEPSTIPDSEADQKLIHRWVLDDVNGTVEDSVGDAGGTNNGVTSVDGDFAGGSAGDGDGSSSYISVGSLPDLHSIINNGWSIAFTVEGTDSGSTTFGIDIDASFHSFQLGISPVSVVNGDTGQLALWWGSDDSNMIGVRSSTYIDDGGVYRCVIQASNNAGSDVEMWINQEEEGLNFDENVGNPDVNQFDDISLFAQWDEASQSSDLHYADILDDICVYGDTLTPEEIQSYVNPWD